MRRYWVLFDYDDTLGGVEIDGKVVPTTRAYENIQQRFYDRMESLGFSRGLAARVLDRVDRQAAETEGFGDKSRFSRSLAATYATLAIGMGRAADPEIEVEMMDLGFRVFTEFPYVPLPGALQTLEVISQHRFVAVVTKGDDEEQLKKVIDSGVIQYIDALHVLGHKTVEEWNEVLRSLRIREDRAHAWAVGNSIRSDINPPLQLGLNAIHIANEEDWAFEKDEYVAPLDGRYLYTVENIRDVLRHIPLTQ